MDGGMHNCPQQTNQHRYNVTSTRSPRSRPTVYIGSRRLSICNRSNPVPGGHNTNRRPQAAHFTGLWVLLENLQCHGTTLPHLRPRIPCHAAWSTTLELPPQSNDPPRHHTYRPPEPTILPGAPQT